LRPDDPLIAAQNFNGLIVSIPLNNVVLFGDDEPITAADLEHLADTGSACS
jgi:TetR/AcrR family transcriptional repressor of mexJK operon